MNWQVPRVAAAALAVAILVAGGRSAVRAQDQDVPPELERTTMRIAYEPSKTHPQLAKQLAEIRILERLRQLLAPIRLPQALILTTRDCGTVNLFYSAPQHPQFMRVLRIVTQQYKEKIVIPDVEATIVLCYEFFNDHIVKAPKDDAGTFRRDEVIVGGIVGATLHEVGHALFDLLRVPVLGREEDAADQIAAYLVLQFNPDLARRMIKGMAYTLKNFGDDAPSLFTADEHGTPSQRFFNTICMAYGKDPVMYRDLAAAVALPLARLRNCGNEYREIEFAYAKTIQPHVDPALMRLVQETPILHTLGIGAN